MNTDGLSVCICVHLCSIFIDFGCGCKLSGESDVFWEGEHRYTRMNTDGLSVCICVRNHFIFFAF